MDYPPEGFPLDAGVDDSRTTPPKDGVDKHQTASPLDAGVEAFYDSGFGTHKGIRAAGIAMVDALTPADIDVLVDTEYFGDDEFYPGWRAELKQRLGLE